MAPLASSMKNGTASGLLIRTRPAPSVKRPVNSRKANSGVTAASSLKAIGPSAVRGGGLLSNVWRSARLRSCPWIERVGASPSEACAAIVHGPAGPVAEIVAFALEPE